jgi:O-antigen/teichoic acid export membrane protein
MTTAQNIAPVLRRLRRNMGVLAGGGVATAALGVATTALNARALGSVLLGILALVQSYALILGRTTSFDTWQGIIRFGGEAQAHGEPRKLVGMVSCAVLLDAASAVAAGVAGIVGLLLFAGAFNFPHEYVGAALFYTASLFFQLPGVPIGLMRLFDKFHWLTGIGVAESAARLVAAAILFSIGSGLAAYIYAYGAILIAANLFRIAIALYLVLAETGPLRVPGLAELRSVARSFMRFSAGTWVTSTLNVTRREGSLFVVAAILGPAPAGDYTLARRIVQPIYDVAEMLRHALFPDLSRMVANHEHQQVTQLIRRVLFYTVPAAMMVVVGASVFGKLGVKVIAGPGFGKAYWILIPLATAAALYLCMPLLSSLVILYAGMKTYTKVMIAAAFIWAALFTLPILQWQVRGAGAGEVIFVVSSFLISSAVLRSAFRKRELGDA